MRFAPLFFSGLLLAGVPAEAQDDTNTAPVHAYGPVITPVPAAPSTVAPTDAAPAEVAPPLPADTNQVVAPATGPTAEATNAPTNAGPKQDEIYDIRPPLFFLRSWLWLWIALVAAAAVALLVLVWNWFKTPRTMDPRTAYDLTLEKLEKARALMSEEDPAPYAVFVSETIRGYLGQRFLAPSTRRTTEEFLRQMEADTESPLAEHRDLLREFLQSCDLVKFAKYQPTMAELEQVQDRAFNFVTATKPMTSHRNGSHP
jgi:hypothetical protein